MVDLKEDTIRKFSCSLAIHVRFSFLSAKVINLAAKCRFFGVYFLCYFFKFMEEEKEAMAVRNVGFVRGSLVQPHST